MNLLNKKVILEEPCGKVRTGTIVQEYTDYYDVYLDEPWTDNPKCTYRYHIKIDKDDFNKTWFI